MKYTLTPDRTSLVITVDDAEREDLRESIFGPIQSDKAMHDFFEKFIANSEFDWVNPADTGDLTDAPCPMLGILSEPKEVYHNRAILDNPKNIIVGCTWDRLSVCRVVERWAFMDYQVISVLERLRDSGQAVFIGGPIETKG